MCRSGEGSTQVKITRRGATCEESAGVHIICPGFGVESGGTDVYIWGNGFTDSLDFVQMYPFNCKVVYR